MHAIISEIVCKAISAVWGCDWAGGCAHHASSLHILAWFAIAKLLPNSCPYTFVMRNCRAPHHICLLHVFSGVGCLVTLKFVCVLQEAERAGISIDQRSIPIRELQACLLAGTHLIVALVDKRRLCDSFMCRSSSMLQGGGVSCIPSMCGYGEAYTGKQP